MAGQPQIPGWLEFDVTNLEAVETAHPTIQQNILDLGEEFDLKATFTGAGTDWENMKADAEAYEVMFYAEGFGATAPDLDLGPESGNLGAADTVEVFHTVVGGVGTDGVYRCAAVVTFPGKTGVLGFYDQLLIQVNELEDV